MTKIEVSEKTASMLAQVIRLTNQLREAARTAGCEGVPIADTEEVLSRLLEAELTELRFDCLKGRAVKNNIPRGPKG